MSGREATVVHELTDRPTNRFAGYRPLCRDEDAGRLVVDVAKDRALIAGGHDLQPSRHALDRGLFKGRPAESLGCEAAYDVALQRTSARVHRGALYAS